LFISSDAQKYWLGWELSRHGVGMHPLFSEDVAALAVSSDGRLLAAASQRGVVSLWELGGKGAPWSLPQRHEEVRGLAFSPDSRTLAVNHGREVRLWQVGERGRSQLTRTLSGHSRCVHCLAFHPREQTLASAGQDHVVLWDLDSGRSRPLIGHMSTVDSLAFSPDGRTLASGGADGKVHLWQVRTASQLLSLSDHTGPVRRVAFAPDGKTLASGGVSASGPGEAYLWQAGLLPRGADW
jgi:WD40 repeat protein